MAKLRRAASGGCDMEHLFQTFPLQLVLSLPEKRVSRRQRCVVSCFIRPATLCLWGASSIYIRSENRQERTHVCHFALCCLTSCGFSPRFLPYYTPLCLAVFFLMTSFDSLLTSLVHILDAFVAVTLGIT